MLRKNSARRRGALIASSLLAGLVAVIGSTTPAAHAQWPAPLQRDTTFGVAEDSTNNVLNILANYENHAGPGFGNGGEVMRIGAFTQPSTGVVTLGHDASANSAQNTYNEVLLFTPNPNVYDLVGETIQVNVCDEPNASHGTYCTLENVKIQITPQNDAPVANDDLDSVALNGSVTTSVVANDTDIDGDTLKVSTITVQAAHGVASVSGTSQITYTPLNGFVGTDSYKYSVCDPSGACDTATVFVWVSNDPPLLIDDGHSTPEDTADTIDVLANDITDGNCGFPFYAPCLQIVAVSQPAHGNVTINAVVSPGTVHYIPNANFNGIDTFTYVACTLQGQCSKATVTETVEAVNDLPVARDDLAVLTEGQQLYSIDVLSNDSDEDANDTAPSSLPQSIYVHKITVAPLHGIATVTGTGSASKVQYTPNSLYSTLADSFTYQICDTFDDPGMSGTGGCATAVVHIMINADDKAPVAVDDAFSTPENTPLVNFNVTSNDSDPDGSFAVTTVAQPAHGSVVYLGAGNMTYTPNANWNGNDSFDYVICDIFNKCDTGTVTINVGAVNYAPVARNDIAFTPELNAPSFPVGGLKIDVLANDTDADGDPMTVNAITVAPSNGTAFISGNKVVYFPTAGYVGTDDLTYQVCDPSAACSVANVHIFVSKVNGAPIALRDATWTNEDTTVSIAVLANDIDPNGDPIYIAGITVPASHGEVIINGAAVEYTPDLNWHGIDQFTYLVCDNTGACSEAIVQVTVKSIPDAPIANDDLFITSEDTPISLTVLDNDSDGDNDPLKVCGITLAPTSGLAFATIEKGLQTILYSPGHHFYGHDTLQYRVCDPSGMSDTATVQIVVLPVNHTPNAIDDIATTPAGDPVAINVKGNDSDEDGDAITVKGVSPDSTPSNLLEINTASGHGKVTIDENNNVYYVPNYGFKGQDEFWYTLCDTSDACDTAHVVVSVGYDQAGSIEGHVYMDLNGNGQRDGGEPDLQGVKVELYLAGPDGVFNTVDDVLVSEGTIQSPYIFDNLPAATYQVRIDQSTVPQGLVYTQDPVGALDGQAVIAMGFGKDFSDQNFGFGPGADLPETR